MLNKFVALIAAAGLMAGASYAAPAKKAAPKPPAKATTKIVDVYTCPVTGEKVKGQGAGTRVAGKYRVHFCCPGCDKQFDAWSAAKKQQVAAKYAAKEAAAKK